MIQSIARKQIAPLGLWVLVGCTSISWLITAAIAPEIAQAYTARVEVALSSQPDESYANFLRRAEAIARAAAQRSFDGDILVTDVAVTIIGEHNNAIAPIMLLEVSRPNWKRRPIVSFWATYFPGTQSLLDFSQPSGSNPPAESEANQ
ncbi:hypothetical protein [Coleofasciculus sp. F4-SAH-05]|jgi:hypothetical protein|uniref:hypothetical protein n=1 Tax=Coleofasciculus TaxID=669368 RepID=UPI0032F45960